MEREESALTDCGCILDLITLFYFIHCWICRPEHSAAALTTNLCSCVLLIVEANEITAFLGMEVSDRLVTIFQRCQKTKILTSEVLFLAAKGPDCRGMCESKLLSMEMRL